MKFDDLLVHLGEFGWYQKRVFCLACLPFITAGIQTLIVVFTLEVPDTRCAIPGLKNDTYKSQGFHQSQLINYTMPEQKYDLIHKDHNKRWGDAGCYVYQGRNAQNFPANGSWPESNNTVECHKWVYDKSMFQNTFVTEIDLVCEDKIYRDHATMIFMCGQMVGSFVFGYISDKYGRKVSFMATLVVQLVTAVSLSFVHSFAAFATIRFFTATGSVGALLTSFVLAMEIVGPSYRAQAGVLTQLFWVFGEFLLAGAAYLIREWRVLQLVMGCHIVLYLVLYWLVPESPRWQIGQGKVEQARATMEKVAKSNGTVLPDNAFDGELANSSEDSNKGEFFEIFKSKTLLFRLFVITLNWLVVAMVYYGLTLSVGNLGGSVFSNFALSAGVEIPANFVCAWALPRWGRKKYHCFSMLLGGIACLGTMVPGLAGIDAAPWVLLVLSNIGKFGVTGGFSTIFVFTAELFPTFMRNSVMGVSSMGARIGTIGAPYIADLGILVGGRFGPALPLMAFGLASCIAGLSALTLPETLNKKIPETIDDAINFNSSPKNDEKDGNKYNENKNEGINLGYYDNERY